MKERNKKGQFVKGVTPWSKGRKLGAAWNTGKKWSQEVKDKIKASKAVTSPETRLKMSIAAKRRGISKAAIEACKKHNTGRSHSKEWIEKVALAQTGQKRPSFYGEKHWNWQGGKTSKNQAIRMSPEYKAWRTAVFKRDNHTCRICGKKGGYNQADHIKPFSLYPELRLSVDNGRTLCRKCHRGTPTYAGRARQSQNYI